MRREILSVSLIAIAAATSGSAAHAQAANTAPAQSASRANEPVALTEIIVTATKRAEAANTVPMSITAVSGDTLQKAGISDPSSLIKIVPGFQAVDSSYGTPIYYLRGVGFFDSTLSAKPTVGVYVDEVPLPFSAMTLGSTIDLERVEVLKGPQGTLFGSNATGGAINYIAAKPTNDFRAGADLGYGNFDSATVGGFVSGPITSTVSGRLSLRHESRGDWQTSTSRPAEHAGSRNFTSARAQLRWEPTSTFRALLSGSTFLDRSDTQSPQFTGVLPVSRVSFLPPAFVALPPNTSSIGATDWTPGWGLGKNNKFYQAALRADWDISEHATLTSISAYSTFDEKQSQDADGTPFQNSDYTIVGSIRSFNQELRVAGKFGNWTYVVGGNYEHSKTATTVHQFLSQQSAANSVTAFGLPAVHDVNVPANTLYTNKALFGNVDFDPIEMVTLHAGLRYTETNTDFNGCVGNDPANSQALLKATILSAGNPAERTRLLNEAAASGCNTVLRINGVSHLGRVFSSLPEHNLSWRAGADFKPAAGQLFYVNVSRGYKAGSYSGLTGPDQNNYIPAPQEAVTAYEAGMKSSLFDHKLQLNAALFYYDYTHKQLIGRTQVAIFGAVEALVSIPKSRVEGAELQLTAAPIRGLLTSVGVTYVNTKITQDYTNYNQAGVLTQFNGRKFPYTPEWQINGDVNYTFPVKDNVDGFVGGGVTYRSSTYGDFVPDPRFYVAPYALLDLRAGIEQPDGAWRVSLYGRNVTNKYYWTTATRRADALVRWAGMPRTYGIDVTLRYK